MESRVYLQRSVFLTVQLWPLIRERRFDWLLWVGQVAYSNLFYDFVLEFRLHRVAFFLPRFPQRVFFLSTFFKSSGVTANSLANALAFEILHWLLKFVKFRLFLSAKNRRLSFFSSIDYRSLQRYNLLKYLNGTNGN